MSFQEVPIRRLASVFLGKMLQPAARNPTDVQAPYLRAAHVQPHGRVIDVEEKSMFFGVEELVAHDLRRDDVVIVEGGAGYGRSAVMPHDREGWGFQNSIVRLRPTPGRSNGRFLNYALQAAMSSGAIEIACFTATIPHFTADKVAAFRLPAPPLDRQVGIADYLDRETEQIDTLISEQERLIELLRERRTQTVARATGWGQPLQAGWTAQRVSWLFTATASGTTPTNEDIGEPGDGMIPWVTTSELRENRIATTSKAVSREVLADYSALKVHPRGSVLIAMYGATIGRLAVLDVDAASNQACCALVGPTRITAEFAAYSLLAARPWLLLESSGGGQPNINQDKVRSLRLPIPDLEEQRRIVADLDRELAVIDALASAAQRLIELAKERRSALITAAVTGKIEIPEAS